MLRSLGCLLALVATLVANAQTPAPQVQVATSLGNFTLELHADKAPKTVTNFLRYVEDGFYDGTIFHRVIDGFMIQGGGFTEGMTRKETRGTIPNEADNGLTNSAGTIAMARTANPHSASSQFFINVVDNRHLDHTDPTPRGWGYTVFGRVTDGMDTIDKIRAVETTQVGPYENVPVQPVTIKSVTLVSQ